MFAKTFGCVRFIYNKMLGDRLDYYKETGKKLNNTPAQYKEDFPWLKEVDSLASSLRRQDTAPILRTIRKALSG
ncbi:helix-turn-helix domain-containing protein [Megasphaera sp.]|uniref:helix-turn-helix domain-containing protein n=1 Tax=Megasphaera sp. TaxID=2023260 RepID=UPI0035217D96